MNGRNDDLGAGSYISWSVFPHETSSNCWTCLAPKAPKLSLGDSLAVLKFDAVRISDDAGTQDAFFMKWSGQQGFGTIRRHRNDISISLCISW